MQCPRRYPFLEWNAVTIQPCDREQFVGNERGQPGRRCRHIESTALIFVQNKMGLEEGSYYSGFGVYLQFGMQLAQGQAGSLDAQIGFDLLIGRITNANLIGKLLQVLPPLVRHLVETVLLALIDMEHQPDVQQGVIGQRADHWRIERLRRNVHRNSSKRKRRNSRLWRRRDGRPTTTGQENQQEQRHYFAKAPS